MPFQNDGTFLENIILTSVASFVLERTNIDFVNSFAMPPLSPWVEDPDDPYDTAISPGFLSKLKALRSQSNSPASCEYLKLLDLCVEHDANNGPNGALLVALLSKLKNRSLRMWLNDIPKGRYKDSIKKLKTIRSTVNKILGKKSSNIGELKVCSMKYPNSLKKLDRILSEWSIDKPETNGIIGYLDPWYYRTTHEGFNDTASFDHQEWLRLIGAASHYLALSVHFNADYNGGGMKEELKQMHEDGIKHGFHNSISFVLEYFAITVSIRDKSPDNILSHGIYEHILDALREHCAINNTLSLNDITVAFDGKLGKQLVNGGFYEKL